MAHRFLLHSYSGSTKITVKTLVCLLVILNRSIIGLSQPIDEIDSLNRVLRYHNNSDAKRLGNITSRLGWLYQTSKQYDSSVYFYKQSLVYPDRESRGQWRGNVFLGIGTSYLFLNEWDSALINYKEASSIFEALRDSANIAIVSGNISILYSHKDLYKEALSYALKALLILENKPDSFALASCYNNVAIIHKRIKNYPEAQHYFRKALAIRLEINQPLEVAKSYNNLGELFTTTRQYDSAHYYLTLAADMKRNLNDTQGFARTFTRLGKVQMLLGNPSSAESYLTESLHTQREMDDNIGLIETLNNLGELYLTTNRLKQSDAILREANTIIHQSGTPEYLKENLELRVELARKQKDFATGMTLLDELLVIRDSLLNEEKSKSLQAMHIRYETKKKEQEIALLEQREAINQAQIKNNRILIVSLIAGLLLIATIGILIYINLKNTKAAKNRFELLLSETRHRIKNNLQTLASIFHLQTRHYTNHEMILEARSAESRVHTMSLLHERFYTHDVKHIVNGREYIEDLVHKLVDIYGSHTPNLNLSTHIEEVDLDIDKALALSLIIQELVCNAFKYAFDHEPNPELTVEVRVEDDHVVATIHDNGIGFNGQSIGSSQGLSLVDALVAQLDGNLHMNNREGTTFIIRFPATSLWKRPVFSS